MQEIWKDIKGYEGYYQISNLGRVKSLSRKTYKSSGEFHRTKKERIKVPKTTKDGYNAVTLSVNCKDKTFSVHSLVANAFITKPDSKKPLEINHIDTNRKNNCADNLEWVTHEENVAHSVALGHYSVHSGEKNGRCVPVTVCTMDGDEVKSFSYLAQCAEWLKENAEIRSNDIQQIASHIKQRGKKGLPCYGYRYKFN
nr:MAG TPA: homing endonuclease [Caudoviricetes sp.]